MVRRVHTVQIDSQPAQSWPSNSAPEEDGYIEPSKSREEVRQGPYPLSKGFDWSITDVNEPAPVWTRQSHICKSPPHFFVKECMNSCQRTTLKMSKLRSGFSIRRVLGDACVEFSLGVYHRRSIFFLLYRSLKYLGRHKEWRSVSAFRPTES